MASFRVPWYRITVFALLIASLAWWIHYRDVAPAEDDTTMPPGAIGPTAAASLGIVVLDVLPYAVKADEPPAFWVRLGNEAWDIQVPGPGAAPDLVRGARERRVEVFEEIARRLEDLRSEVDGPDALVGEIRRGKSVPPSLYMEAFQVFIGAGFGTVNVALTEGKPPGAHPR